MIPAERPCLDWVHPLPQPACLGKHVCPHAWASMCAHMPGQARLPTCLGPASAAAGSITEVGLRTNLDVALQYMESWLRGVGCVPIHNLMEDAATAEISRSQVGECTGERACLPRPGCRGAPGPGAVRAWQCLRHGARTLEGRQGFEVRGRVCGLGLQVWQWVRHGARTKEGKQVTADWVARLLDEECDAIRR